MAFGFAVYASWSELPQYHAKLASSCWSGSTEQDSHLQGSDEGFQIGKLHLIPPSQALLGAIASPAASWLNSLDAYLPLIRTASDRSLREQFKLVLSKPFNHGVLTRAEWWVRIELVATRAEKSRCCGKWHGSAPPSVREKVNRHRLNNGSTGGEILNRNPTIQSNRFSLPANWLPGQSRLSVNRFPDRRAPDTCQASPLAAFPDQAQCRPRISPAGSWRCLLAGRPVTRCRRPESLPRVT